MVMKMEQATNYNGVYANIEGNKIAPDLKGVMFLYPYNDGTIVEIEVINMPKDTSQPYALHIHEGNSCDGENFESSKGHYNPTKQSHPMHSGDLPPLFSNNGYSYMRVYTNRFTPDQVVGRTVIIHNGVDDFKTQPSGNSGAKIACGVIEESKNANNRYL